jgi:hypothetical protein
MGLIKKISRNIKIPKVKIPKVKVPKVKVPKVKVPKVKVPKVKVPKVKIPKVKVPPIKVPVSRLPKLPKLVKKVHPARGSVVYCKLGVQADHSGIYIGYNRIVHLDGNGTVEKVTPEEFLHRLGGANPAFIIYTSCRHAKPVGSHEAAKRAKERVGTKNGYNLVSNNCHQFSAGCLTGKFKNHCNTFTALKHETKSKIHADGWQIWKNLIF